MKIYVCHRKKDRWFLQKEFPNDTIVEEIEEADLIIFLNHFEAKAVEYVIQKNKEAYRIANLYISAEEMRQGHIKERIETFLSRVRIRSRSRGYER